MQVRVLAPINTGTVIDLPDDDAWTAKERGQVSFVTEENDLLAALLAGTPYTAPPKPPAQQPT